MENAPTIHHQLSSADLFHAFKVQLAKDFAQSNFSTDFVKTLEPAYDLLLQQIADELQCTEKRTDSTLMHLLNRIDISEAQLKRYLGESGTENYFLVLAELIIKRVLQKVVVKQYYKNKEG